MDWTAHFANLLEQRPDRKKYDLCNMARSKNRRSRKKTTPPPPPEPFPFMSLPPEIRLMVYNTFMPKEVCLGGRRRLSWDITSSDPDYTGLPCAIKSLMKVKAIRSELAPHLFARYHFVWFDSGRWPYIHPRWESLKRHAIPFINNFSFWAYQWLPRPSDSTKLFASLLKWMRWRSLRSHLHPWHLKNLTLAQAHSPPPAWRQSWTAADMGRDVDSFLMVAPVVPGLDSLNIVLGTNPSAEAVKYFLERCADYGAKGRIGYWQYDREEVTYWLHLQDDQIVRIDGQEAGHHYTDGGYDKV